MRPYRLAFGRAVLLSVTVSLGLLFATSAAALPQEQRSAQFVHPDTNPIAKRGFDQFYSLEYDKAIKDFESLVKDHPDDPFANNYLLTGLIFRELYRIGALNSESYAGDSFLDAKPRRPLDPNTQKRIRNLLDRTEAICDQRLKSAPNDVDVLYARGATRGLRSTFMGMGEKSWLAAVRSALGARKDHEKVLELNPNYTDAKMVVGVHNYIIGSLNWAARAAVALIGVGGSRDKGLNYLREVAHSKSLASMDAKIALALFLRREQRYSEALDLVRGMTQQYPRNFLMGLEYANLLNAAGHGRDAIAQYEFILNGYRQKKYPLAEPAAAALGLGISLRGQREYAKAAEAFDAATNFAGNDDKESAQRAALLAGEMYDTVQRRDLALKRYEQAASIIKDSDAADTARKRIKKPFRID